MVEAAKTDVAKPDYLSLVTKVVQASMYLNL